MIVRSRYAGNVELRAEWGTESRIPAPGSGNLSSSGLPVTLARAIGLPAVSTVIRSAAEVIASLPFIVYRDGAVRERAPETWQYARLHDRPAEECDSFEFFFDLALSLEATQNAFVQKVKAGRQVEELYVLDPQRVTVRRDRDSGEKRYDVWLDPQTIERDLTSESILHIRGFSPHPGALAGVSLLHLHRDPLGAALAMQGFEGDYFRQGGIPPFWFTGAGSREHAKEIVDSHNAAHAGVGRQWKPGGLWGAVDVKHLPISMQDALFADAKRLAIEDVCRIWRWPRRWAGLDVENVPADELGENLKLYVLPRLRRIERAFAADPDLFWGTGLFGEFLTAALERADFVSRIRAYKDAIQGGHATPNETRQPENLPPHPDGDRLQFPVVGGGEVNAERSNGRGEHAWLAALLEER